MNDNWSQQEKFGFRKRHGKIIHTNEYTYLGIKITNDGKQFK